MNNTATIGDNSPPADANPIKDRLTADYGTLEKRKTELLDSIENAPETVEDEATCETLTDFIKQLKLAAKETNEYREWEKLPHLDANKTIQSFFMDIVDPLKAMATKLEFRVKEYHTKKLAEERAKREEAERIAREEAEAAAQKTREAEEAATNDETLADAVIAAEEAVKAEKVLETATKAANASTNDMTRTTSDAGTTSSMSTFMNFRNLDMAKIDLESLRPYINQETIEKAIRAAIRNNITTIKGVEIFEDIRSRTR